MHNRQSFIDNPDLVSWPESPGEYWFYGYRYGKDGAGGRVNKKELA